MDDLQMIKHPKRWPVYPFLPLKRRVPNSFPECGYLCDGFKFMVFKASMFDPVTERTPTTKYNTAEEVIRDGWEVD
jgi:hypothetical protein